MSEIIQAVIDVVTEVMDDMEFVNVSNAIAGICTLAAVLSVGLLAFGYLRHRISSGLQRVTIRIILIVPYYAVTTYLSLVAQNSKVSHIFDAIRDLYEALTLYFFFKMCVEFAGGENALGITLESLGPAKHPLPLKLFPVEFYPGRYFLFVCKQVLCHFVIVKPIMTVVAVFLTQNDMYGDGDFTALTKGYVWLQLANFISFSVSFYFLLLFYNTTRRFIGPMQPVRKFFTVKTIVILVFWQAIIGNFLIKYGFIIDVSAQWPAIAVAKYLQRFLLCIEMFLMSLVLQAVFATKYFHPTLHKRSSIFLSFLRLFDFSDIVYDVFDCYRPANIFGKKFEDVVDLSSADARIETTIA